MKGCGHRDVPFGGGSCLAVLGFALAVGTTGVGAKQRNAEPLSVLPPYAFKKEDFSLKLGRVVKGEAAVPVSPHQRAHQQDATLGGSSWM